MSVGAIFCADDYGISPGVGKAIRDLAKADRISATSCMTGGRFWPKEGAKLVPFIGQIEIGIHITLTDQRPLGPMPNLAPDGVLPSVGKVLQLALLGRLDRAEIEGEINRQLEAFKVVIGRQPDFVDGHQHIQQFPIVRDVITEVVCQQSRTAHPPWIRSCWESPSRIFHRGVAPARALVIGVLGLGLRQISKESGLRVNSGFAGIYNFDKDDFDENLLARMLKGTVSGTVYMCHPGFVDEALKSVDTLTTQREREFAVLMSDAFPRALTQAGVRLVRATDLF